MSTINAGVAMVKVLESWGVDHIYGIPGGSFNSIMDALYHEKEKIKYIQVRHEEVGALAAAADAKLTGKVGAVFGSAGPGATHLINGLYDAQMDHVPLVALLGQVASAAMNYNSFQELNENPIFADVSVYNRTVMTPQSLPHVVDEAIKAAYEHKGVAIVTIPVDLGFAEIEEQDFTTAATHKTGYILPDEKDLLAALPYIEKAKKPVLYVGQGTRNGFEQIKHFSEHFSVPVVASVLAKGIVPDSYKNFLGFAGRVATKPANEALAEADLILFVGSDFPFGRAFFNPDAAFIQTDVGNTTIHSIRLLDMNGNQKHTTSGWFATMGNGVPGGIAAQLSFPEKQVFTLSGDGGFAMVMQDIITQVKYQLPIINVVFSNDSFGFIEAEQEDTEQKKFGVFLEDADFGKASEALGADSFTITDYHQLRPAFDAAQKSTRPVVIDVKIENKRPLPVEDLHLDPRKYSADEINAFKEKYEVHDMPVLNELYEKRD